MNAQELRLFNIVKEGMIFDIGHIDGRFGVHVIERMFDSFAKGYLLDDIHPLEITPELLEKAGFKKTKSSYEEAETYDFYKGIIYLDMANNSMKVNGVYALSFIPEYFHQLQNLYFDLTGEEITT